MKQIHFSEKSGDTQLVIDGRITQAREIVSIFDVSKLKRTISLGLDVKGRCVLLLDGKIYIYTAYNIGDVVPVAQSFQSRYMEILERVKDEVLRDTLREFAPFISAESTSDANIPCHHVCISNIRVERLQDISDADCLASGVRKVGSDNGEAGYVYEEPYRVFYSPTDIFATPREAYMVHNNRDPRLRTWDRNPYVVVYDFELID